MDTRTTGLRGTPISKWYERTAWGARIGLVGNGVILSPLAAFGIMDLIFDLVIGVATHGAVQKPAWGMEALSSAYASGVPEACTFVSAVSLAFMGYGAYGFVTRDKSVPVWKLLRMYRRRKSLKVELPLQKSATTPAPVVSSPTAPSIPSCASVWKDAVRRMDALSRALMDFETDPESVYFTRPLLRDVTEPTTAAFYEAYSAASVLCHEHFNPSKDDSDTLFRAVTQAERAWECADKNARRKAASGVTIGGRVLNRDEADELRTAQRALERALNHASTPHEAAAAWELAQRIVTRLDLQVPDDIRTKVVSALPSSLRGIEQPH